MLRALILRTGEPRLRAALGVLRHEAGDPDEAVRELTVAHAADPQNAHLAASLVTAMLSAGRPAETLPIIERERARAPLDQRWLTYLADAARQLGRPEYPQLFDYDRFVQSFDLEPPPGRVVGRGARVRIALAPPG